MNDFSCFSPVLTDNDLGEKLSILTQEDPTARSGQPYKEFHL